MGVEATCVAGLFGCAGSRTECLTALWMLCGLGIRVHAFSGLMVSTLSVQDRVTFEASRAFGIHLGSPAVPPSSLGPEAL